MTPARGINLRDLQQEQDLIDEEVTRAVQIRDELLAIGIKNLSKAQRTRLMIVSANIKDHQNLKSYIKTNDWNMPSQIKEPPQ
jgi:hypothetical protein